MSTAMRNVRLGRQGEPISRGGSAAGRWWRHGLADLEHWAKAKPRLASLTLSIAYLLVLSALVGVLAAAALNTAVGIAIVIMFAAILLACVAVAIYTVIPERNDL